MKFSAVVVSPDPEMHECFIGEQLTSDRCEVTMEKTDSSLTFHIAANDSVALRSVLNSITKLFTVYEKTKEI